MAAADLSRTVFGRHFQNPLLLAAGTAGFGRELDGVMDLDRLGGIVTKAVSLAPRAGNPRAARGRVSRRDAQLGRASPIPGSTRVRDELLPVAGRRTSLGRRSWSTWSGFTVEEYAEVVGGLDGVPGIAGFELNLSCPNTSAGGIEFGADPECVRRIVVVLPGPHPAPARRQAVPGPAGHRGDGARGPRRRRRRDLAS